MAAITGETIFKVAPGPSELLHYLFVTPSSADSNDTLDVSGLIGDIKCLYAWDEDTGDLVTATETAGVITIDAAGGTTNHTYGLAVWGTKST